MKLLSKKELSTYCEELSREIQFLNNLTTENIEEYQSRSYFFHVKIPEQAGHFPSTKISYNALRKIADHALAKKKAYLFVDRLEFVRLLYVNLIGEVLTKGVVSLTRLDFIIRKTFDSISADIKNLIIGFPVTFEVEASEPFNVGPVFFYEYDRFIDELPADARDILFKAPAVQNRVDAKFVAWAMVGGCQERVAHERAEFAVECALSVISILGNPIQQSRIGLRSNLKRHDTEVMFVHDGRASSCHFSFKHYNPLMPENWQYLLKSNRHVYNIICGAIDAVLNGAWVDEVSQTVFAAFTLRNRLRVESDIQISIIISAAIIERLFNFEYSTGEIKERVSTNAYNTVSEVWSGFDDGFKANVEKIYKLRSDVMHGRFDPFIYNEIGVDIYNVVDFSLLSYMCTVFKLLNVYQVMPTIGDLRHEVERLGSGVVDGL